MSVKGFVSICVTHYIEEVFILTLQLACFVIHTRKWWSILHILRFSISSFSKSKFYGRFMLFLIMDLMEMKYLLRGDAPKKTTKSRFMQSSWASWQ